jgi:protease I
VDFDAVVFIGGPGALERLDNEISYKLARDTIEKGKILAAICVSPAILAKAGVLKSKKAVVWSSALDKSAVKILEDNGAIYEGESVVIDGKIITAHGPSSAQEFGEKILLMLQ